MILGRQEGMSTVAVMALVGAASGIIIAATQILDNAKKNFKIAEIQSVIDLEFNQLELLMVDPVACLNTFGPANTGGVSIAAATPAAPVNVVNIRDGEAIPNVVINTADPFSAYLPRNPTIVAPALRLQDRQERSKVLLVRVGVGQGNNTGGNIAFNDATEARDIVVANNQFLAVFNFQIDPLTNQASINSAGGQPTNFFRSAIINATFNGGGQVVRCSSLRANLMDQRYVNMKQDDRILVPLTLFGRVRVFQDPLAPWSGYVRAVRLFSLSDERKKEALKPLENSADLLNQINGKIFDWKNGPKNNSGVIAQDIEKVLPDLVNDENGTKSVNYNSLMALSTAALKSEMQATQELEISLIQLKKRVQYLKDKNHALKK